MYAMYFTNKHLRSNVRNIMKRTALSVVLLAAGVSTLFLSTFASGTSAWAADPAAFWCGTLDRELEVKTDQNQVQLLNPDAENGPEVTSDTNQVEMFTSRLGTLFSAKTSTGSVEVFVSQEKAPGSTNLYTGWLSLTDSDGRSTRSDVTCVAL
jgi:hypothetical protein